MMKNNDKPKPSLRRMNGLFRSIQRVETLNSWGLGKYYVCWIPFNNGSGNGFFSAIDFAGDDLSKIDPNKVEIIYPKPVQK